MPIRDADQRRAYQREWRRRRRDEWIAGRPCISCGGYERLEVHHRDPAQKVAHAVWSWRAERRDAELAKCIILCRPCHEDTHAVLRKIDAKRRNPCGTYAAYKRGCRCDECRGANAEYQRDMRRGVRDSNPRTRLCRPLPNRSVNSPSSVLNQSRGAEQ